MASLNICQECGIAFAHTLRGKQIKICPKCKSPKYDTISLGE